MNHSLSPKQHKTLTTFLAITFIIMELIWMTILTPWLSRATGGGVMLDMSPARDTATLISRVLGYGRAGIVVYDRLQVFDLLFPAVYASLLLCLITEKQTLPKLTTWGVRLTLIATCADYLENLFIRILLHDRKTLLSGELTTPLYLITFMKFVLLGVAITELFSQIFLTNRKNT